MIMWIYEKLGSVLEMERLQFMSFTHRIWTNSFKEFVRTSHVCAFYCSRLHQFHVFKWFNWNRLKRTCKNRVLIYFGVAYALFWSQIASKCVSLQGLSIIQLMSLMQVNSFFLLLLLFWKWQTIWLDNLWSCKVVTLCWEFC